MNKFRSAIRGGAGVAPSTPLVSIKKGGKADGDRLASVEILRDSAHSADHRDDDSHRLARETAIIDYKSERFEVDLINLSGGGAMIEADIRAQHQRDGDAEDHKSQVELKKTLPKVEGA